MIFLTIFVAAILVCLLSGPLFGLLFVVIALPIAVLFKLIAWSFRGPRLVMRDGVVAIVDPANDDEPEIEDWGARLTGALDIEYVDAKSARTERYIEAHSLISHKGILYLWGYCEIRQAARKFRLDRIVALSDGETGEVVEPENIEAWLRERAGMGRARRVA